MVSLPLFLAEFTWRRPEPICVDGLKFFDRNTGGGGMLEIEMEGKRKSGAREIVESYCPQILCHSPLGELLIIRSRSNRPPG